MLVISTEIEFPTSRLPHSICVTLTAPPPRASLHNKHMVCIVSFHHVFRTLTQVQNGVPIFVAAADKSHNRLLTYCLCQVFISTDHEKVNYGNDSPGPSVYTVKGSIGKQCLSMRTSSPSWKMGSDGRFNYDFINRAKGIPGAGNYENITACGKQVIRLPLYARMHALRSFWSVLDWLVDKFSVTVK